MDYINEQENNDKHEAFVYKWINLTNQKIYFGYHKGSENDGYISSSRNKNFWKDFYDSSMTWHREIIFRGTKNECLEYEQKCLLEINLKEDKFYNNARGAKIIFTEEVLNKMSTSQIKRWRDMPEEDKLKRNKNISEKKKGKRHKPETLLKLKLYSEKFLKGKTYKEIYGEEKAKQIKEKLSKSQSGKKKPKQSITMRLRYNENPKLNPMYGKTHSAEFKEKRRLAWILNNPGKNKSKETIKKISDSLKGKISKTKGIPRKKIICPHCDKIGGEGLMQRWHFNNCKNRIK